MFDVRNRLNLSGIDGEGGIPAPYRAGSRLFAALVISRFDYYLNSSVKLNATDAIKYLSTTGRQDLCGSVATATCFSVAFTLKRSSSLLAAVLVTRRK